MLEFTKFVDTFISIKGTYLFIKWSERSTEGVLLGLNGARRGVNVGRIIVFTGISNTTVLDSLLLCTKVISINELVASIGNANDKDSSEKRSDVLHVV